MDNLAAATLLVICNAPDAESAGRIARILVERRLAACVNIGMPVQSIYRWQGAIEHASEIPLMIKTSRARYAELESALLAEHPYEVPEILAFAASSGAAAYLQWVADSTSPDQPAPAQR